MNKLLFAIVILFVIGCGQSPSEERTGFSENHFLDFIINHYKKPSDYYVLVVAHRGDWRNFPENSLEAIRGAIKIGVDMVEIDIRKTIDGHLVLMHDQSIDRTTNGNGKVTDKTLDELKSFKLINNFGDTTDFKIPTLNEALLECKGKVMINLDKADDYFDEIYLILQETNTINQVVLKGHYTTEEFKAKFGSIHKEILYMPLITSRIKDVKNYVNTFESLLNPSSYEVIFNQDNMDGFNYITEIRKNGDNVWVNTLWASLANGKTDEKALLNPDENWGWIVKQGATIIQTDRSAALIKYLKSIEKH